MSKPHAGGLGASLRSSERGRVGFLLVLASLIHMAQTVGFVGAEALFLARLGAPALPPAFLAASLSTVAASLLYAARVGRARNDRVFIELFVLGALAVGAAAAATAAGSRLALGALFCLFFAGQAILVSHFWSLCGDLFDTLAQKRVVPLLTLGMSAGGALGGGLAWLALQAVSPIALLGAWAALLLLGSIWVRAARARLRRWGVLEFVEEDETSVAALRAALRYLRRAPLGRWLALSAFAMVLSLFVAQYLYSDVFAHAFPDEAALAGFLAGFLAVTNLAELGVELWVTPRLISRSGVASANLAHPALTLLSFAALSVDPRLGPAAAARVVREPLENALAAPVRNLLYNAVPNRLRPRVRASLEGVVVYSGMSLAGVLLLGAGGLDVRGLAAAGGGLALLYGLANLRVRREYLRALVTQLRAGALDLSDLEPNLGRREISELVHLWEDTLSETRERPPAMLRDLAILLASRGLAEPLEAGLSHPAPEVRGLALDAVTAAGIELPPDRWRALLGDSHPEVVRAALEAAPAAVLSDPRSRERVCALLADAAPGLRAAAARRLEADGEPVLLALARSSHPDEAVAGLAALPLAHLDVALERRFDPDAHVRAAALSALARPGAPFRPDPEELSAHLADRRAEVRAASVPLLARLVPERSLPLWQRALRDASRTVRRQAQACLRPDPPLARRVALGLLDDEHEEAIRSALELLASVPDAKTRAPLRSAYARRVQEMQLADQARALAPGPSLAARFLEVAWLDLRNQARRLAFDALAALEGREVVERVERALRFAAQRVRADALEVLSNLGPRPVSESLVRALEAELLASSDAPQPRGPTADPEALLEAARRSRSSWLRRAAARAPGSSIDPEEESIMERLLFLRRIPLFTHLSLDQLEAIDRLTRPEDYAAKEVIVREDTPGEELYLIEQGEVEVRRGYGTPHEIGLNRLGPGAVFGEMAVLDGARRSATVIARTDTRLRRLDGARFRELIYERPEMAFDIFRVLTERLRQAERRLSQGASAPGPPSSDPVP